ncbi:MAG: putative transposase [Nitrososphaera sp.]
MELFENFQPEPGSPLRLQVNGTLRLCEVEGVVEVKYGFIPLVKFTRGDRAETYLAAVTLADNYQIPYILVAQICQLDRNTVSKLVQTKRLLGLQYIFESDKGPKAPWKVVDEIVAHIDQAVKDDPDITNAKIVALLEQAGHSISETSVRKVRNRYHGSLTESPGRLAERKTTLQEKNRVAERIVRRDLLLYQMQFFQAELPETVTQIDPFDYDQGYANLAPAQQRYLKSLRVGMPCQYAGGFLYSTILERFGFRKIVQQVFGDCFAPRAHSYALEVIFLTLFFSIVFHFPSIEALKKAKPLDWGVLLGRRRLPNRKAIHKMLNQLTAFNRASKLMKDFAVMFVKEQIVDVGILFFDEHFLPYYGIERIQQGFFSTRHMVLEGNYQFWAHDMNGRPVFVITTDAHLKLRDMIPEMIRRAKEISGRESIMIVFDRGGYSIELFELIALANAVFVTWAKYVPEMTIAEIKDEEYSEFVFESHGHRETYKLYSTERVIKEGRTPANQHRELKKMTVRMIVVWRLSTGQKTALYTNDKSSPMEKLAEPMTRRWSEQENIFQKMMRRYNLNYHPGYYIDELANQPLVANPKIKSVKAEIKELEYRITQQKQQLATRMLNLKNKNVSVEAYEKRQRKTLPKLQALEQQLASLQQQLQALPEHVSIIEALAGGKLSACDLEKKKIYDVIQIVAYNAEQLLLESFQKHYHDTRDIEQILDMIINYGGYIKLYNNTLYVIINYLDQPAYRRAAVELCKELNAVAPKTMDTFQFPIFFKVMAHPQPMSAC